MTAWREPEWRPDWLTPDRLCARNGFVLDAAEIARRGAAAASGWGDRLPPVPPAAGRAWVLVGGAGFLGARIAAQLLGEAGDAPVAIVSRRPAMIATHFAAIGGEAAAEQWLRDARLRLVTADIAERDIGWTQTVPAAAVVIHLGAAMHALAGWPPLHAINLGGLRASVALARRDDAVLQLASTLSVHVSSNAPRADVAAPVPAVSRIWLHGGYAQTKAAAEHALIAAGLRRWQIVRYGLLVPEAGVAFPPDHFAPAFAAALRRVAAVPDEAEHALVDLTPVDGAAAAAICIARGGAADFVHHANPAAASLAAIVDAIGAASGRMPVIAAGAWRARVAALPAMPRALLRAAFHKSRFLETDAARAPLLNVDLFQTTHRRFVSGDHAGVPPPAALLPGIVASMLAEGERP